MFSFDGGTFVRSSEAAFTDPREGWAFASFGFESFATPPTDFADSDWVKTGTPLVTSSLGDPFGGTDASRVVDDATGSFESVQWDDSTAMQVGNDYRATVYVAKDADTSRFPEVQFKDTANAQSYFVDINTSTGASAVRTNSGWLAASSSIESYDSSWWKVSVSLTSATANSLRLVVLPAVGTTLGVASVAAVGGATFYVGPVERRVGWRSSNQPRIFSDGGYLSETSRTNLCVHSWDFKGWTAAGASVTAGQTAPDGSSRAYTVADTAGGLQTLTVDATASSLGNYFYSIYVKKDSVSDRVFGLRVEQGGGWTGALNGGAARIDARTDTGATQVTSGTPIVSVSSSGDWWRFGLNIDVITTGTLGFRIVPASGPSLGVVDVTQTGSIVAWGAQVTSRAFSVSPVRTSGSTATAAGDQLSFAAGTYPAKIATGKSSWTFKPLQSSSQIAAGATVYSVFRGPSNSGLTFRGVGGACRIAYFNTAGAPLVDRAVTFSRMQEITVTMDFGAGAMTIAGCSTGDGTFSLSTNDSQINPSSDTIYIGNSSAGANQADAVLMPPRG